MTGLQAAVGYGGEFRIGTVRVPDERIDTLSRIFAPKKTTYAEMIFSDIPGEHGTGKKGLSTKALQQIREQEALCLVLRDFENPAVEGTPDPLGDLEAFHIECVLADLQIVERRLDRARKEKAPAQEVAAFEVMKTTLEDGRPLRSLSAADLDRSQLRGYQFLTDRALLVALNRGEAQAAAAIPEDLGARIESLGVEAEIAGLAREEQQAFLEDLGLHESALARFIRTAYGLLDLISFFTVGEDEVRAWTIRRGTNARAAAGRIHSDLERGFIRAEVIPYAVFIEFGSEQAVKDAGRMLVAGKDYIVADGDIMHVRFAV
jgi:ribosome-binding ATPase